MYCSPLLVLILVSIAPRALRRLRSGVHPENGGRVCDASAMTELDAGAESRQPLWFEGIDVPLVTAD
ncbi:MAG: hypothetical protein MPN21_22690 [Thermoanaerobaculia bacterium]|nr:hypothetical protein [Thermoanaerobaculia bacterium]